MTHSKGVDSLKTTCIITAATLWDFLSDRRKEDVTYCQYFHATLLSHLQPHPTKDGFGGHECLFMQVVTQLWKIIH